MQADADPSTWVAVTGSLGLRGRRHRKAAIRMLLSQGSRMMGGAGRPNGVLAWAISQAAPLMMRRADGRLLVWVWKDDPELLVVMAQLQDLTPQLRAARAMMPIEYDDTESFRGAYLGMGERLVIDLPPQPATPPFATYTWDTGAHLVTVTAVSGDRERFRTVLGAADALARSVRIIDDLRVGETTGVLRLDPA
ncbi:hypothetical protein GCM10010921_15710 [Microbacterium album]|uniref:Uncharacterized protein n=1 Tax=Microbacterium album TaxID=2053191 RepID=A0A917MLH5_9MICO|nr:hypothetical protein GCM10010921_15710 [Microbacterium album]